MFGSRRDDPGAIKSLLLNMPKRSVKKKTATLGTLRWASEGMPVRKQGRYSPSVRHLLVGVSGSSAEQMSSRSSAAVTVRRLGSAAVSKTDQQKPIIFSIIDHIRHLGLGGSMLGYGLVGTIVVIAVIILVVRAI